MDNLFYILIISVSIMGWYFFIKENLYAKMYKDIKIQNIRYQIIVRNKEEDIEVLIRKLMYINEKYNIFEELEFIDDNSKDNSYEILEKIAEKYNNIKVRKML